MIYIYRMKYDAAFETKDGILAPWPRSTLQCELFISSRDTFNFIIQTPLFTWNKLLGFLMRSLGFFGSPSDLTCLLLLWLFPLTCVIAALVSITVWLDYRKLPQSKRALKWRQRRWHHQRPVNRARMCLKIGSIVGVGPWLHLLWVRRALRTAAASKGLSLQCKAHWSLRYWSSQCLLRGWYRSS